MSSTGRTGGGRRNPHKKHSVSKVLLVVSIFLISVLIPLADVFSGADNGNPLEYTGDHYDVRYKVGTVDDLNKTGTYNTETSSDSFLTVRYHGVAVAEYNPQFWKGSIQAVYKKNTDGSKDYVSGHAEIIDGSDGNWYPITDYEVGETAVFTGWSVKVGNETKIIDPGTDLSEYMTGGNSLTLTATWSKLERFSSSLKSWSNRITEPSDLESIQEKYVNVVRLNAKGSDGYSDYLTNCTITEPLTIRGVDGAVLWLTKDNKDDSVCSLKNDLIIDQVEIVGTDTKEGIVTSYGAIYAQGHKLILGTGIESSKLSVYGGVDNFFNESFWTGNNDDWEGPITDVRIFSGRYHTLAGGSMEYGFSKLNAHLTVVGGNINGAVYGGNLSAGWSIATYAKQEINSTTILIVGGIFLHEDKKSSGSQGWQYEMPEDTRYYVSVIGGSRYGKVVDTHVTISGEARVFMVQGGGRAGGGSSTTNSNVIISGGSEIFYLVSGGVTDGYHGVKNGSKFEDANMPVVNANVTIKDSAVIGNEGHLYEKSANNANESEDRYRGVVFGGGWDTGANSYLSDDYGSPVDGIATPTISCKTTALSIEGGTIYGAVFGGGYRGNIGEKTGNDNDAVKVSITGGNIYGNVYGGGRGGPDRLNSLAGGTSDTLNKTGVSHIYGNVVMDVSGGTVHGSIYGGGQGVEYTEQGSSKFVNFKDVGTVFGSVRIDISGDAKVTKWQKTGVGGDIFCAGRGFDDTKSTNKTVDSREVAKVTGSVSLNIDGGAEIDGSVYGGGEIGRLGDLQEADSYTGYLLKSNVEISLNKAKIGGNVFGGGLGVKGITSTYVKERTIDINGATIGGSVYGGSKLGDDNNPGGKTVVRSGTATINIVSGNIADGTSGNVYGGGYAGHSYFDVYVNIGKAAVDEIPGSTTSGKTLKILSVFGGSNVGVRDSNEHPELLFGDTEVRISDDLDSEYAEFTITGDIFGGGDYCDAVGDCKIFITGFDQGNSKVMSIQKADDLTITDSRIKLAGNVDGSSMDGSNRLSLNLIGMFTMNYENRRCEVEVDYAARSISGYASNYSVMPDDPRDYNLLKVNNGKTFFILGKDNKGNAGVDAEDRTIPMGSISGRTLFQSDANDYYGAFIIGHLEVVEPDTSFWILKYGEPTKTRTTDYDRSCNGTDDTRAWFLTGAYSVEKTAVFINEGKTSGSLLNAIDLDYILPKIAMDSHVEYTGYHLEIDSPGSLVIDPSMSTSGSGLKLVFGQECGRYLKFENDGTYENDRAYGITLTEDTEPGFTSENSDSMDLRVQVQVRAGFDKSGYAGSVVLHFAEVKNDVALGIFDVKVSIYLRTSQYASDIYVDMIMRSDGSVYAGTTDIYLPALDKSAVGDYRIGNFSGITGSLKMNTVLNNLGKDGWIDGLYRSGTKDLVIGADPGETDLGTGAVFSPVLRLSYQTEVSGPSFDKIMFNLYIYDEDGHAVKLGPEGSKKTYITVHVQPILVQDVSVTISDKVLTDDGKWKNFSESGVSAYHKNVFMVKVGFGTTLSKNYIAYKNLPGNVGAEEFLSGVRGSFLMEDGEILVSTDKETVRATAEAVGGGYTVISVKDFLGKMLEAKPDSRYTVEGKDYVYDYSVNWPTWNNGALGLSRFNFERQMTVSQNVFSSYGVAITLKAVVDGEVRGGYIRPDEIFPVQNADSGEFTVDPSKWDVTYQAGYKLEGWYSNERCDKGDLLANDLRVYSNLTIYGKLTLIKYRLSVEADEGAFSTTVSGLGEQDEDGCYTYTVISKPFIDVVLEPGYHISGITSKERGKDVPCAFTIETDSISFTPPALSASGSLLVITVTTSQWYTVSIILPETGESDNSMFGFDSNGHVSAGGTDKSHEFQVVDELSLNVPALHDGRGVVYTIYDERDVVEFVYRAPSEGELSVGNIQSDKVYRLYVGNIQSDKVYRLYVTVVWNVTVPEDAGFSIGVEHLDGPEAGTYTSGNGTKVHAGDRITLMLDGNHQFDRTFTCTGATWDTVSVPRVYTVDGGSDVVFGKATLTNGELTIEFVFKDDGHSVASTEVYGSARLVLDSSVQSVFGGSDTDPDGKLKFSVDAVIGGSYVVRSGFAGYENKNSSFTMDREQKTITVELGTVYMTVDLKDGDTRLHRGEWKVTSQTTVKEMWSGADQYAMWYGGSGFVNSDDENLSVPIFGDRPFYDNSDHLTLRAVPFLRDVTSEKGLPELHVLFIESEPNGPHLVQDIGNVRVSGTLDVGGETVRIVYRPWNSMGMLTIDNCPEGTGALRLVGDEAVLLIIVISEPENI